VPLGEDLQRHSQADRSGVPVLGLGTEREVDQLRAVAGGLQQGPGDVQFAADAVALHGPVHPDVSGGRDLLDDAGDERPVPGGEVQVGVRTGYVQRVGVLRRTFDVRQPPVGPVLRAGTGIDDGDPYAGAAGGSRSAVVRLDGGLSKPPSPLAM
jgi:hypothetical protein